jgi:hypothetical protein
MQCANVSVFVLKMFEKSAKQLGTKKLAHFIVTGDRLVPADGHN